MIEPTVSEIERVVPGLSRQQFIAFVRGLMERTKADDDRPCTWAQQYGLYLYEWLIHLNLFGEAQAQAIVKNFRSYSHEPPLSILTIIDRRYVTWTGYGDAWFDAQELERISELPVPGVTYIACHLRALYDLKQAWLERLRTPSTPGQGVTAK